MTQNYKMKLLKWFIGLLKSVAAGIGSSTTLFLTMIPCHSRIEGIPDPASISWKGWGYFVLVGMIVKAAEYLRNIELPNITLPKTSLFSFCICLVILLASCATTEENDARTYGEGVAATSTEFNPDGTKKSEFTFKADIWDNNKTMTVSRLADGTTVFSNEFDPAVSLAELEMLKTVIPQTAQVAIRTLIDSGAKAVNPVGGLSPDQLNVAAGMLSRLEQQSQANSLPIP